MWESESSAWKEIYPLYGDSFILYILISVVALFRLLWKGALDGLLSCWKGTRSPLSSTEVLVHEQFRAWLCPVVSRHRRGSLFNHLLSFRMWLHTVTVLLMLFYNALVRMCAHMWRPEIDLEYLPQSSSTSSFEERSVTRIGAHYSWADWSQ